jgi:hypothetical protein
MSPPFFIGLGGGGLLTESADFGLDGWELFVRVRVSILGLIEGVFDLLSATQLPFFFGVEPIDSVFPN